MLQPPVFVVSDPILMNINELPGVASLQSSPPPPPRASRSLRPWRGTNVRFAHHAKMKETKTCGKSKVKGAYMKLSEGGIHRKL